MQVHASPLLRRLYRVQPPALAVTSDRLCDQRVCVTCTCLCACVRAADVVGAFKTFIAASTSKGESLPSGVDMQVQVLTSGFWPSYPIMEAKLPEVRVCVEGWWNGDGPGLQSRLLSGHTLELARLKICFPGLSEGSLAAGMRWGLCARWALAWRV